jgi:hypothetical protein
MSDPRDSGEHVIKIGPADPLAKMAGADEFVHTPAATSRETHITLGHVLWTLTHNGSTAQARRWVTAGGFELQMQIWSGARVDGQEDLCWTQLFATDELLADTALAKKRQLEASGWLEDLEASAR